MDIERILKIIEEQNIQMVDLRFTDTFGKEQHVTTPATKINDAFFENGRMFDGSSISGWKSIDQSDMILKPDPSNFFIDPFTDEATLAIRADVIEPSNSKPYQRCPRSLARRAEEYLLSTGIATHSFFGPEPEFFVFDNISWQITMNETKYTIDSSEGAWNSGRSIELGNKGHRPLIKGGYFPVPPVDSSQDLRTAMTLALTRMGIDVEAHHHEVATANQNEISTRFNTLTKKADEVQMLKYVVHNVAHAYNKTATFMPKPLFGDNGNGMHIHLSLAKDKQNLFAGEEYGHLSKLALYFIGGIIRHAKALNAFTNPSINSYKRLIPGFEAPTMLAYSARNRSAAIRIPYTNDEKARRIEIRFPDPMANPYLAFAALLMAGLDGIDNKIAPGNPFEHDLYEISEKEAESIPQIATSLEDALAALRTDYHFLLKGNVFSTDLLEAYIELKKKEVKKLQMMIHPLEFEMYYSL